MTDQLPLGSKLAHNIGLIVLASQDLEANLKFVVAASAFRDLGLTWASMEGTDSHGEMGSTEDAKTRLKALDVWLRGVKGDAAIRETAVALSRGTALETNGLIQRARELEKKVRVATADGVFVSPKLAQRLAEAGVLPMFGMPTNVRMLYFRLPASEEGEEALSLDRPFDQAISDFAPGAQRTWDKRVLKPSGLCGDVMRKRNQWIAEGQPIGAAYQLTQCLSCRLLEVELVVTIPNGMAAGMIDVECSRCANNARRFIAVAPTAFVTDLRTLNDPEGWGDQTGRSGGYSFTAAPALRNAITDESGGSRRDFARQAQVFRINTAASSLFPFIDVPSLIQDEYPASQLTARNGKIWQLPADDASAADRRVALTSPKITDVLAISAAARAGLSFFNWRNRASATRSRATWRR